MEKRIGTITILLSDKAAAPQVNEVISSHSAIVLARQGLPFHDRPVAVISLIVEGDVDEINSLSGQLGKIQDVTTKAVVTKS
jgi:putative iron-only hydrogenase system regulator